MFKTVVAATAAVTIASSTMAYAQQREGRDGRPDGARSERPDGSRRWQPTMEDMRAFQAARLAALRAGLVLNAEQDRHWPAFEQAMRELQQLRLKRVTAMREARREASPPVVDPAERMRQRATRLSESGSVLKRLADTMDPLYRSLDDAQKRRFAILSRSGRPRGGWNRRGRDGGEPGMQRGQRRTDVTPTDAAPQAERMAFTGKTMDDASVGQVFGSKLAFGSKVALEDAVYFASKTIAGEGALFVGKATPFSGKFITVEDVSFSRKITIGEPPVFGRKAVESI